MTTFLTLKKVNFQRNNKDKIPNGIPLLRYTK